MVKSIIELPSTYRRHCRVLARNAIFLLITICYAAGIAADIILHLWYSAMIPREMLESLHESVLPLIEETCKEISLDPQPTALTKEWEKGSCTVKMTMRIDNIGTRKERLYRPYAMQYTTGVAAQQGYIPSARRSFTIRIRSGGLQYTKPVSE